MRIKELYEGRTADLYHSTSWEYAVMIMQSGKIEPSQSGKARAGLEGQKEVVSLTRDKNFFFGDVMFVIDQAKLAQTHKIRPFADIPANDQYGKGSMFSFSPEHPPSVSTIKMASEEVTDKAIPIRYVKKILVQNDISLGYAPNAENLQKLMAQATSMQIPIRSTTVKRHR